MFLDVAWPSPFARAIGSMAECISRATVRLNLVGKPVAA